MDSYDPLVRNVTKESSIVNIRNLIENYNLNDSAIYPTYLPIFQVISVWLQKAVAAKENAIIYYREANDAELEVMG